MKTSRRMAPSGHPVIRSSGHPLCLLEGTVADRAGNLFITDSAQGRVLQVTPDGRVVTRVDSADLSVPTGLALDEEGSLYISDSGRHQVLKLGQDSCLLVVAGTGVGGFSGDGAPATTAQLNGPWGLALDLAGRLFIADAANHRIRQVAPDGTIRTVVGTGLAGFLGDGGPATAARLDRPLGLAVNRQGNLFMVDSLNGRVRKVDGEGVITTVFCATAGYYPASIAEDHEGNLLVADPFQHRIITVAGVVAPPRHR
jgi:sugar lactone lactonase YvrE